MEDRKIQMNNTALDWHTYSACNLRNEAGCEQSMMQKDMGGRNEHMQSRNSRNAEQEKAVYAAERLPFFVKIEASRLQGGVLQVHCHTDFDF
jgi:hypothetical protein